jgi:hypothetical protein
MVYGAAHDDLKMDFLTKLAAFCHGMHCPYIVGGDFNILRHSGEKNRNFTPSHFSDLFNTIIHLLGPREIFMHGGKYTWSNKHVIPTMEKLDRVLMSPEWEDLFPLVHVRKLVRDISDHKALLLNTGEQSPLNNKSRDFRFDLSWLKNEELTSLARQIWEKPVRSLDPIDVMNIKLKRFKKYFKGRGSNLFGNQRKRKNELKVELESLESMEEESCLYPEMFVRKSQIFVELQNLFAEEEL